MSINLQALKDELTNDPLARGYAGMDDVQVADSLAVQDRQPNRETLTASMLMGALDEGEYNSLVARGKTYWGLLIQAQTVPLTDIVKTTLSALFPNPSTTRTNLLALLKRTGTRAEELGLGGQPTPSDVANARRLL